MRRFSTYPANLRGGHARCCRKAGGQLCLPSGGQQGDKLSFGKIGITAYGTGGKQGTSLWQAVFYLRYQRVVMRPAASDNQRRWLAWQSGQAVANRLGG